MLITMIEVLPLFYFFKLLEAGINIYVIINPLFFFIINETLKFYSPRKGPFVLGGGSATKPRLYKQHYNMLYDAI